MEKDFERLKSESMRDFGGYSIVDESKLCDSLGNVVATAHRVFHIGDGNFLLEDENESQKIFDREKQVFELNLPAGIAVVPWTVKLPAPLLGYGCYLVQDGTSSRKQGIATRDGLILPCEYEIDRYFNELKFHTENPFLLFVRKGKSGWVDGIFDLKQRQFVLPCEYLAREYKEGLLSVTHLNKREHKWGVFDVESLRLVVPAIYDSIKLYGGRTCKCVTYKSKLWFGKREKAEIEIHL